ncbi:MAG: hypothetical protein JNK44_18220 [Cyclobacteriaceae bacterium]|nr:hypothetical protein [Cyclobacteriaceae bacterium]
MMMRLKGSIFALGALFLITACELNNDNIRVFAYSFEFSTSDQGWDGDFADYPIGDSVFYELKFKHDTLPRTNGNRKALLSSGKNHSDDLFMFIRRKLTGLKPNTEYRVLFNVRISSNVPTGNVGVGGAPGESVFVKAGAVTTKPEKVQVGGYYRMNVDIGSQSQAGADVLVIGNIGVAPTTTQFTEIYRNNSSANSFLVTTDSQGEVWILVGTDSGFEGTTTVYYTAIDILFNQAN